MSTFNSYLAEMRGADVVRFQTANRLAPFVIIASLVLYRMKTKSIFYVVLYIFGVLLVGISGHRSVFIDLVFLSWVTFLISFWKQRWVYFLVSFFGGLVVIGSVYLFAADLPTNFQRAISFLPGISISEAARMDAMITIDWRLNLWNEGLTELQLNPMYLILGKGLTYSAAEYMALQLFDFHYWWAILTSNYHQGVLSLLIITGTPGLLFVVSFFGFTINESIRNVRKMIRIPFITDLYLLLVLYFILLVFKYFVVYGDMTSSFIPICYTAFLLKQLHLTYREEVRLNETTKT